jgi:nucleoside-diphosphate-sugar epimerase
MLGPGTARQCFAYVDDVADGVLAALERARAGSAYVLGGDNRPARDLFDCFHRACGVPPPRRRIPFAVAKLVGRFERAWADWTGREPRLTDEVVEIYRHEWAFDSSRAVAELGYRITPLEQGIERTVAWLRERGELP